MRRDVEFTNADGVTLSGSIALPAGRIRAVALFAHCFTCTAQSHGARRVSLALAERGIATLRFDFTGLGGSKGDFADSDFTANVGDLVAAADFLRDDIGAPSILIGHSLGGAAVIAAAADIAEAKAVVTIGAPFDPAHVLHQIGGDIAKVEADGQGEVTIGGRPFRIGRDFLAAVRDHDQGRRLAQLKRALLVLHAPTDAIVGIDNAKAIFDAARHPKSFVALEGADHLLTGAAQVSPVAEGHVRVTSTGAKFVQIVDSSGHTFVADEPISVGGSNLGPTPYDLLLSALGTCTAMTIKLVAATEAIPLTGVAVTLDHRRHHADDCAAAGGGKAKLEVITRAITLEGDLSDDQRDRLLTIADKCPVHRTLEGQLGEGHLRVETRLA